MSGGLRGFDREPEREFGPEPGPEVSLPKSKCEDCGGWFVDGSGELTVCEFCEGSNRT